MSPLFVLVFVLILSLAGNIKIAMKQIRILLFLSLKMYY